MKTFAQIGTAVGNLVQEKNAAYGDSITKSGEFLRLLFPNGIKPDQYDDAFLLARDFDKSMRIATNRDAFGENPWLDKSGYGVVGVHLHQQKKESSAAWQGSANAPDATNSSKAQPDSITTDASSTTTTSESEIAANAPSQPPASSSAPCKVVIVPTVMEPANGSEVDLHSGELSYDKWLLRHSNALCIACSTSLIGKTKWEVVVKIGSGGLFFFACSQSCWEISYAQLKAGIIKRAQA